MARLTTATCYNEARTERKRKVLRGTDIDIDDIVIWQLSTQYQLLFFCTNITVIVNTAYQQHPYAEY